MISIWRIIYHIHDGDGIPKFLFKTYLLCSDVVYLLLLRSCNVPVCIAGCVRHKYSTISIIFLLTILSWTKKSFQACSFSISCYFLNYIALLLFRSRQNSFLRFSNNIYDDRRVKLLLTVLSTIPLISSYSSSLLTHSSLHQIIKRLNRHLNFTLPSISIYIFISILFIPFSTFNADAYFTPLFSTAEQKHIPIC